MGLKKGQAGLGLLELIVAMTLLVTVLLGATALFLGLKKTSLNFFQSESSLMETVLAAHEEMVRRITVSNMIDFDSADPSQITVWVDEPSTPGNATDDVSYVYAYNANDKTITRTRTPSGGDAVSEIIAKDVTDLTFTQPADDGDTPLNRIVITLTAKPANGPTETIETTAIARGRGAF